MSLKQQKQVLILVCRFVLAFGFIWLIMIKVIKMDRYLLNIFFLLTFSLLVVNIYKNKFIEIYTNLDKKYLFLLLLSLIVHVITSYLILSNLTKPVLPFKPTGISFLLINSFFIWVKPLDVFVQQLLFILLIKELSILNISSKKITLISLIGFGFLHIFQIFNTNFIMGIAFTLVALVFSIIFPYLILKVKNGPIFNYVIHLGVYTIAALLSWIIF